VPLAQVVVDELAAHMTRRPVDSEWLFPADDGGPLGYMTWYWAWEQAKATAGEPRLVTHDLRHFCASALIAGGASVKLVQSVLATRPPWSRSGRTRICGRATTSARGSSSSRRWASCGLLAD